MKWITILFFLIVIPLIHADTPPPEINFWVSPSILHLNGTVETVSTLRATTSWDPSPTTTITCTDANCRLEIQDCNASIDKCESGIGGTWDNPLRNPSTRTDSTCAKDCTRAGVIEDTVFSVAFKASKVGSRHLRACWYDSTLINCSAWQRVHTYNTSNVIPVGAAQCRPETAPVGGGLNIYNKTCVYDQNGNRVPLVVWINKNIQCFNNCQIQLVGANIEFNAMNGKTMNDHKISVSQNSSIKWIYPKNYDQNYVDFFNQSIVKTAIAIWGWGNI